jgi:hypothetical protein
LRELGELSTEETARSLQLSVGAVKSRLFHGRRKLHERLRHQMGWRGRPFGFATRKSQGRSTCTA